MLKIRLMRIGAKKKPFYRVVVVDERAKRTGAYIELLGTYNPLTEPKDIKLKQDRIDHWVKQGAQMSTGFLRIIGKAPQRPPRKPKKASKQVTGDSEQIKPAEEPAKEEPKAETKPAEETPKEETTIEIAESETEKPAETAKSSESEATGAVKETPADTSDGGSVSEAKDDSSEVSESEPGSTSKLDKPATPESEKNEGSA